MSSNGVLQEGDVFVSSAGALSCQCVIHAVGPRWNGGQRGERDCLKAVTINILQNADSRGMTSISIPAISTGIFNFPLNQATDVIVSTVIEVVKSHRIPKIKYIHLVDRDLRTVTAFQRSLEKAFGKTNVSSSIQADTGNVCKYAIFDYYQCVIVLI